MNEAEQRLTQVRAYATQCIKEEAEATLNLINQLDENFDKAVSLMFHCTGKVIVTGVGKSGNIGAKIAATLSSTDTPKPSLPLLTCMIASPKCISFGMNCVLVPRLI